MRAIFLFTCLWATAFGDLDEYYNARMWYRCSDPGQVMECVYQDDYNILMKCALPIICKRAKQAIKYVGDMRGKCPFPTRAALFFMRHVYQSGNEKQPTTYCGKLDVSRNKEYKSTSCNDYEITEKHVKEIKTKILTKIQEIVDAHFPRLEDPPEQTAKRARTSARLLRLRQRGRQRASRARARLRGARTRARTTRRRTKRALDENTGVKLRLKRSISDEYIKPGFHLYKKLFGSHMGYIKNLKRIANGFVVTVCKIQCKDSSSDSSEEKSSEKKKSKEKKSKGKSHPRSHEPEDPNDVDWEDGEWGETAGLREHEGPGRGTGAHGWGPGMGCFPGESTVTTPSGLKLMKDLQFGDEVLTMTDTGEAFVPVTWFHHADPDRSIQYLRLRTTKHSLLISDRHLLPILPCSASPDALRAIDAANHFVFASRAKPGYCLVTRSQEGAYVSEEIQEVTEEPHQGVYAPITQEGTLLVDGVVASCYTTVENQYVQMCLHNGLEKIWGMWSRVSSWLGAPPAEVPVVLRVLLKMTQMVLPSFVY